MSLLNVITHELSPFITNCLISFNFKENNCYPLVRSMCSMLIKNLLFYRPEHQKERREKYLAQQQGEAVDISV